MSLSCHDRQCMLLCCAQSYSSGLCLIGSAQKCKKIITQLLWYIHICLHAWVERIQNAVPTYHREQFSKWQLGYATAVSA